MQSLLLVLNPCFPRCIAINPVQKLSVSAKLAEVKKGRLVTDLCMPIDVAHVVVIVVVIIDIEILLHVSRRCVEQVRDLILLLEELYRLSAHYS